MEAPLRQVGMVIGAERRPGTATFESVDPYTGEPWAVVPEATQADVNDAVRAARAAFDGDWTAMPGAARGRLLRRLGELITSRADDLADAETRDNGKLLREMGGQVRSLPAWYEYYAGLADKIDGRVVDTGRGDFFGYVSRQPVGVVASILPWNSPLLLLTFKLAPALAAGCTMVAKPSEQAPVSIMALAELSRRRASRPASSTPSAGRPARSASGWSPTRASTTCRSPARRSPAPRSPGPPRGTSPRRRSKLGGKSANIVFPDADLEAAANGLVAGIFAAAGQTCIAGSRGLVHVDVYDEVMERVAERAQRIVMGDPKLPATEMGPICFPGQLQKIQKMVQEARDSGARIVTGGDDRAMGGLFYAPTIVADVTNDAPVCQEEIFGPVLGMLKFTDEEEAIAMANDTRYGLAAGIWTKDIQRAFRLTKRLRVGTVWVNAYRTLNFAMPFGGVKASGFGRENGTEGLHEYLRDKAVWIEMTGATRDPFVLG